MTESLAAVVVEFGKDLELRHIPIPELEPGGVLVRVDAATLCGTDVHFWHGQTSIRKAPTSPATRRAGRSWISRARARTCSVRP